MALISHIGRWMAGIRLSSLLTRVDAAEALAGRLRDAGAPPGLPARHRAAYDRCLDALNRLPRPVMVLGSLALVGSALVAPAWFGARMDTLSQMPEGLWWLIGAVFSLHFGARYQARAQAHDREIVEAVAQGAPPEPATTPATPAAASPGTDAAVVLQTLQTGPNAALAEWASSRSARAA